MNMPTNYTDWLRDHGEASDDGFDTTRYVGTARVPDLNRRARPYVGALRAVRSVADHRLMIMVATWLACFATGVMVGKLFG